jgi:hypothetical protein
MHSQLLTEHVRPQDVGSVLAAILAASSRPLTRILEDLSGTRLAIRVLEDGERALTGAERFRLDAGSITRCRWRAGLLVTADGTVAASTVLVWLPPRLPHDACRALDAGREPAGVILGRLGMRRADRRAMATNGIEDVTGADAGHPAGYADECVTRQFAASLAR